MRMESLLWKEECLRAVMWSWSSDTLSQVGLGPGMAALRHWGSWETGAVIGATEAISGYGRKSGVSRRFVDIS